MAAAQPAPERGIEAAVPRGREAVGRQRNIFITAWIGDQRDIELAGTKQGFECGAHFRFCFASAGSICLRQAAIKRVCKL